MAQDYIVKLQGQDNLSSTIKNVKDELKSTGESATQLDKIQAKFDKIQSSSVPLKRQMRDLQAIMAQMNMNGLSNTSQFTEIAQYAGKVKDAISGEFANELSVTRDDIKRSLDKNDFSKEDILSVIKDKVTGFILSDRKYLGATSLKSKSLTVV